MIYNSTIHWRSNECEIALVVAVGLEDEGGQCEGRGLARAGVVGQCRGIMAAKLYTISCLGFALHGVLALRAPDDVRQNGLKVAVPIQLFSETTMFISTLLQK